MLYLNTLLSLRGTMTKDISWSTYTKWTSKNIVLYSWLEGEELEYRTTAVYLMCWTKFWAMWNFTILLESCQDCSFCRECLRPLWIDQFVWGTKTTEGRVWPLSFCSHLLCNNALPIWRMGRVRCVLKSLRYIVLWKFSYWSLRWWVSWCHMILSTFRLFLSTLVCRHHSKG